MRVGRGPGPHRVLVALGALAALVAASVSVQPATAAQSNGQHVPPVTAPITEEFRAPEHAYGPGNRGLKYEVEPGTVVGASAAGKVVFAGPVGGDRHVTVLHPDGVRTSYSYLSGIHVRVGQQVEQGTPLGVTGRILHFGARRAAHYFDPASLFGGGGAQVELVPFEVPPGATPDDERAALRQLLRGGGGLRIAVPDVGLAAQWLIGRADDVRQYVPGVDPVATGLEMAWALTERVLFPPPCTRSHVAPEPVAGDRLAVLIGGLGSTSESASIDRLPLDRLGYGSGDAVRFSYAGGLTPDYPAAEHLTVPILPYGAQDTQHDLWQSSEKLVRLLEELAAERPGATIDVYAHSMGGVVTRLALLELAERESVLDRLGTVATFGSPHGGADLATAVQVAKGRIGGDASLEALEEILNTGLDAEALAVEQLAGQSPVMAQLGDAGVPDGVNLVSVGARGDLVVPAPRTRVDGARNVTVPEVGRDAHGDLVASERTARELALALAGLPPACVGFWDVVQDEVVGHAVVNGHGLATSATRLPPRRFGGG